MPPRLSLLIVLSVTACSSRPAVEADRAELLRLHDIARTAHLQKRADLLVASFADSFLDISRGRVAARTPAESRKRFQAYFDRVQFQEWDDLASPIIRISSDGQMAYVIVQKRVRLTSPDSAGMRRPENTVYAWVELYQKRGDKWTLMAVVSTDRPDDASR
jgi:ketosteroid isomerase-like protein